MPSLYVHIPFCEKKCIYCNFYSIESTDAKAEFLRLLRREIALRATALSAEGIPSTEYDTIFFGGGTPSLLSPEELEAIVSELHTHFTIRPNAEFTMECNPGTLIPAWLRGYAALGVNRLSFGVQSFDDAELQFLSRIHSAEEARTSIRQAMEVFDNVSLDLIFALPGQSPERWRSNLEEGVRLGTNHISAYSLIFEEGTPLNAMRLRGEVSPATDTLDAEMYTETMATLEQYGFQQYEVSNYARPGFECRHNLTYWERGTYIAFGPSAHSLLRSHNSRPDVRWANVSSLTAYNEILTQERLPIASREMLSSHVVFEEKVMLGLRSRGIPLDELADIAGAELTDYAQDIVRMLLHEKYAVLDNRHLKLLPKGYPFADRFAVELIVAAERACPALQSSQHRGGADTRQLVEIDL